MNTYFAKQKIIRCFDTNEVCIGYDKYLKSRHWLKLRQKYLPDNMQCSMCGEVSSSLQLHHLTYERLGHELEKDLIPLCEECHKLIHTLPKETLQSELYIKPRKSKARKRRHKRLPKTCKNCKSYTMITIKGKVTSKEPYCKYHATLNPHIVCEKFRSR